MLWKYTEGDNMVPYWRIRNFLVRNGFDITEEREEAGTYGMYYYVTCRKDNIIVEIEGSQAYGETELATGYWRVYAENDKSK